jgi:hypothetical protein
MKKYLTLFLALLPISAFAQTSDLGDWLIYFGNKKVSEKINLHHEVQYRNYNARGDLEQLLLRTGVGYNLTDQNNNILLGYGFILSENYSDDNEEKRALSEHRIYQQFITKQQIRRVTVQHRYRCEQRFIAHQFKMRFRYFLAVNVPLNNAVMEDKTVYLSAYNELFLDLTDRPFDRNRVYGGVGYRLNNTFRCEVGYMNQLFANSGRDQLNVITFLSF